MRPATIPMSTTAASERDPLHERMAQLRAELEARHIDVLVVTHLPNVFICAASPAATPS